MIVRPLPHTLFCVMVWECFPILQISWIKVKILRVARLSFIGQTASLRTWSAAWNTKRQKFKIVQVRCGYYIWSLPHNIVSMWTYLASGNIWHPQKWHGRQVDELFFHLISMEPSPMLLRFIRCNIELRQVRLFSFENVQGNSGRKQLFIFNNCFDYSNSVK